MRSVEAFTDGLCYGDSDAFLSSLCCLCHCCCLVTGGLLSVLQVLVCFYFMSYALLSVEHVLQ